MSELFGLSMNAIMVFLLVLLGVCLAAFGGIFIANRVMFRMGVRGIRRRMAQTTLIVVGLMLATTIITAAFTTGDVVDHSITKTTYDNLQRTDLSLHHFREAGGGTTFTETYVDESVTPGLERLFAEDPDIEGFIPFLFEGLPVLNSRTRLSEPTVIVAGIDPGRLDQFGGLTLTSGDQADLSRLGEDQVLLGRRAADKLEAVVGDRVTVFTASGPFELEVAGIVKDERAAGTLEFGTIPLPAMAARLETVQRLVGREGQLSGLSVVLRGGVRGSVERSDSAAARLEALRVDEQAKAGIGLAGITFQVEKNKQDAIEEAKLVGSIFTTVFLVLGLFSVAAGAMLIFTLFVMLAAERRTEMGIARAVGAQRRQLVQTFASEGMVYDLMAGVVGVAAGVVVALIVVVGGARFLVGEELEFITPYVAPRSLVVSFCLGTVLTFATVVVSSLRISQLNIVAAVRGQASEGKGHEAKHRNRWLWIVLGVPALVVPPLGIYWLMRKGLGMSWAWIVGPSGIIVGGLFIALGKLSDLAFPFMLGMSLIILAVAALVEYYGVRRRVVWTVAGAALAAYWLMPNGLHERLFGKFNETGMEMFVLSGIMIVTGSTLIIVFNARLLTTVFAAQRPGLARYRMPALLGAASLGALVFAVAAGEAWDGLGQLAYLPAVFFAAFALMVLASVRFPRFAPALKMGVAYPLSSRFRTGMTIAMFSLVVFSITVMSIINASFLAVFGSEDGRGGWDIQVDTNRNSPVDDIRAALGEEGSFDIASIDAVGRFTEFDDNAQEARQPGRDWNAYPIRAGDDEFFRESRMKLEGTAHGYEDDRAVYDAVLAGPNLAVVDSSVLQPDFTGGGALNVKGVRIEDNRFEAFPLELRDPVTGRTSTVTVIGVFSGSIPANVIFGIYTNEATYESVLGEPQYRSAFVRLQPGADAEEAAKDIKAALVTRGVQAVSLQETIDEMLATSRGFLRIFQAFMGLGLFVGIASLGVIALRSVVERRQQIGMLRAIGYQKGTVALSFLLESGFIASMGILAGVVGGALLSWRLLASGEFAAAGDIDFFMPWFEVVVASVLAFAFSLVMTWWPSKRAASVPVAEALRYE